MAPLTGRVHLTFMLLCRTVYCTPEVDFYNFLTCPSHASATVCLGIHITVSVYSFSRLVLWLEVGVTNKRPEQVCEYFIQAVRTFGLPETVRTDAGTENVNVHWAQTFLSADIGRIGRLPPVITGSSNHNEVSIPSTLVHYYYEPVSTKYCCEMAKICILGGYITV